MSPGCPPIWVYAYGYDPVVVAGHRVGVDREVVRFSSVSAVLTTRIGVARRSRGIAGLTRWVVGKQVAVLAARPTRHGDQILQGYQAGQPDAHLVL
jgi:hypothetical protein